MIETDSAFLKPVVTILIAVILAMPTFGAVLLSRLFMKSWSRGARVLAAALAGPNTVILPIAALFLLADESIGDVVQIAAITSVFASLAIGWPIAHIGTRRLDRLVQTVPDTFK